MALSAIDKSKTAVPANDYFESGVKEGFTRGIKTAIDTLSYDKKELLEIALEKKLIADKRTSQTRIAILLLESLITNQNDTNTN